jgi:hypothetical protein
MGGQATVSSEKDTTWEARTPISVSRIILKVVMQKEGKLIFEFKPNNLDMRIFLKELVWNPDKVLS